MPTTEQDLMAAENAQDASAGAETVADAAQLTFYDLGLSDTVLAAVDDMGYETPTPVQAQAIPQVLAGRDLLAAAQTGTGKTAAFLLPTMDRLPHVVPPAKKGARGARRRNAARGRGPLMLVITPTRELAQQIDDVCTSIAARTKHVAVTVVGGVGYVPQKQALARGCDILVATPGRLVDLMEQGAANLDEVSVLVLDEADRMLDMGFLPQVRQIVSACRKERQTLLFSATLDESRVGSITDLVQDPARVEIAPVTSTADTVQQYVLPVSLDAKNGALVSLLKKEGPERVIVFVRTKRRADTCARRLARAGITCGAIHGDRSQAQRERALKSFRTGEVQVLVATDVLARGIDISDVRYVVNFDVPEEPTDYIHRIGRTGRAGEEGWSITFVTREDIDEFYDIEALMGKTADLYEPEGIEVGEDRPQMDPNRQPASHVPGKKEKKRRRQRARKGAEKRAPRESKQRAPRQRDIARRAARDAMRSEEAASHPSSRKRPGKARVRETDESVESRDSFRSDSRRDERHEGGEEARFRNRAERRAQKFAAEASERAERSRHDAERRERSGRNDRRGGRHDRFERSERRDYRDRDGYEERSGRHGRKGEFSRGERGGREERYDRYERTSRDSRDNWRNYDEGETRGRRGSRGGRAGGRYNRGSYAPSNRGRNNSRRPGDRGGKGGHRPSKR